MLTNVDVQFVVRATSPIRMRYRTGEGILHYVEYAEEVFDGPRVDPQPAAFLAYARGLRAWLLENFCSKRGKNTADNVAEYERLRGGW